MATVMNAHPLRLARVPTPADMRMTATSGLSTFSSASAICLSRPEDSAPMTATLVSSTGRPLSAETPLAMMAPTVCCAVSVPIPAALLSPSTRSWTGSPSPEPYRPLSSGAPSKGWPTIRRASSASTFSTP